MHLKNRPYSAFLVGITALTASANLLAHDFKSGYLGFDSQRRELKMVAGFGEGLLPETLVQSNFYLGYEINDYLNVELAQQFAEGARTQLIPAGALLLGRIQAAGTFLVSDSSIKLYGTQVRLMGKLPINEKAQLLLSAGINSLKMKATVRFIATNVGPLNPDAIEAAARRFFSRKTIPQFSAGGEFSLSKNIKLRLLGSYEMTSKFKNMTAKKPSIFRMSFKNNLSYGAGLNIHFK